MFQCVQLKSGVILQSKLATERLALVEAFLEEVARLPKSGSNK